jgi:hypothetical protein
MEEAEFWSWCFFLFFSFFLGWSGEVRRDFDDDVYVYPMAFVVTCSLELVQPAIWLSLVLSVCRYHVHAFGLHARTAKTNT